MYILVEDKLGNTIKINCCYHFPTFIHDIFVFDNKLVIVKKIVGLDPAPAPEIEDPEPEEKE